MTDADRIVKVGCCRVKPLAWDGNTARTLLGDYEIKKRTHCCCEGGKEWLEIGVLTPTFDYLYSYRSVEDAKAAAEENFRMLVEENLIERIDCCGGEA